MIPANTATINRCQLTACTHSANRARCTQSFRQQLDVQSKACFFHFYKKYIAIVLIKMFALTSGSTFYYVLKWRCSMSDNLLYCHLNLLTGSLSVIRAHKPTDKQGFVRKATDRSGQLLRFLRAPKTKDVNHIWPPRAWPNYHKNILKEWRFLCTYSSISHTQT